MDNVLLFKCARITQEATYPASPPIEEDVQFKPWCAYADMQDAVADFAARFPDDADADRQIEYSGRACFPDGRDVELVRLGVDGRVLANQSPAELLPPIVQARPEYDPHLILDVEGRAWFTTVAPGPDPSVDAIQGLAPTVFDSDRHGPRGRYCAHMASGKFGVERLQLTLQARDVRQTNGMVHKMEIAWPGREHLLECLEQYADQLAANGIVAGANAQAWTNFVAQAQLPGGGRIDLAGLDGMGDVYLHPPGIRHDGTESPPRYLVVEGASVGYALEMPTATLLADGSGVDFSANRVYDYHPDILPDELPANEDDRVRPPLHGWTGICLDLDTGFLLDHALIVDWTLFGQAHPVDVGIEPEIADELVGAARDMMLNMAGLMARGMDGSRAVSAWAVCRKDLPDFDWPAALDRAGLTDGPRNPGDLALQVLTAFKAPWWTRLPGFDSPLDWNRITPDDCREVADFLKMSGMRMLQVREGAAATPDTREDAGIPRFM